MVEVSSSQTQVYELSLCLNFEPIDKPDKSLDLRSHHLCQRFFYYDLILSFAIAFLSDASFVSKSYGSSADFYLLKGHVYFALTSGWNHVSN